MGESPDNNMSVTSGGGGQPTPHTPTSMPSAIEDFMQQLTSDRLIKIYLGGGPEQKQFLVPQSVLTARSDYFKKAIEHEAFMGTQAIGTLCFPEDGHLVAAWGMMLHWIIHHRLPVEKVSEDGDIPLFVESWVLGDRYLLPGFQNEIMMKLIDHVEGESLPLNHPQLVNYILRISPAGSPLQRLLAEETIYNMYSDSIEPASDRMSSDQLNEIEEVVGITGSLLNALKAFTADPYFYERVGREGHEDDYKAFFVQDGLQITAGPSAGGKETVEENGQQAKPDHKPS